MRNSAVPNVSRSMFLVLAAISVAVILAAAVGCGDGESADPPTPQAAARADEPAAPSGATAQPQAPRAPSPADTPLPPQPAAKPATPRAADVTPTEVMSHAGPRPRPVPAGVDLHDTQVITSVGRMRSTMAPWRDGGGNRLFSTHVFGTPFMLNEKDEALPWIATAITSNNDFTVWTMKLREDAVFQDGTTITAADFKAYWEHGAKPENIVAWGGASLTLGEIVGWEELRAGDTTGADGLTVVDDYTLEIETVVPHGMAAWHVGMSKFEQVLVDESWGNAPIGAGPIQPHLRPRKRPHRAHQSRPGRQALERPARHSDHREARAAEHRGRAGQVGHVRERRTGPDVHRH